ncbi:TOMM precursor leader peptide-binding protein [Streptacidiphilus rugosus]|uniref:TOMM precursor leader peptide-binding protein n=1 Tax=Streptacidiphilus rugosus TaxID=405783 RepID=UPI000562D0CC|nr:TOMM precursor leader peptide-binding protein [Streptacidiphilus rugosus]
MTDLSREGRDTAAEAQKPRLLGFRRHLRAEPVAGDAAYLLSERGVTALQGAAVEALVPLLDGTRDLSSVLDAATRHVPAEEAGRTIGRLAREGLIGYRSGPAAPPAEAYWDLIGLDGEETTGLLTRVRVALCTVGRAPTDAVRHACRAAGLELADEHAGSALLTLVVTDDYLRPELAQVDAEHRAAGRAWLPARLTASALWIGPVFRPGAGGPCWHCLAHRMSAHRTAEAPVRRALGLDGPVLRPAAYLPSGSGAGAQLLVHEAVKWLAGYRHPGQDAVMEMDTLTLVSRHHEARRRPQCPSCGDPGLTARQAERPVTLRPTPKASRASGGHRARTPEEVQQRYGHLVSPLTGVVAEIRAVPGSPAGLHSYSSGHNLALGGADLRQLRSGLRQNSGGKGATRLDAEVGALCEAVERYSATLHGDESRVRDTLRGLGRTAVDPRACLLFDERQYRDRADWNRRASAYHRVPEPFDAETPVDWTPVWSLSGNRQRLLPTGLLYFNPVHEQVVPVAGRESLFACSNGNAAGSSLEDAVLQGLLELVERDAVALWWYNRTRQRAVDLAAFADPWVERLLGAYDLMHRRVWVLDLTSDLGVPVLAALSRRLDKPAQDVMFGFGAHLDPAVALSRALTEMNQLLPAVAEADAAGGGYRLDDPELLHWWTRETVESQRWLLPDPAARPARPQDFAAVRHDDLLDDVELVVGRLAAKGLETLVLDQTRPDLGLPVVKVVVPGLRHFWARFAPGRLFDVPVALGRLHEPTEYQNLNPLPMFI